MIGEKGAAPGSAIYMKTPYAVPDGNSYVKSTCLASCSYKCNLCQGNNGCD